MPLASIASPLQRTISQIERALDVLHPANDREVQLRLTIEEAVEIGYEVIYSRRARERARVIPFPGDTKAIAGYAGANNVHPDDQLAGRARCRMPTNFIHD